ncbi:Hsp70 family protein [Domibacillus sp. PGB-M46]|uniref:Hsp70 family protein n=1 Tax=Domibacillus sp. PGB-M46 TaxID=2910255 RepID=UPI001F5A7F3B|nr:Hsp70 family protein [Domibacillus sp. PGB-M46]MCI2254786.1 Hsp70 family protein [Domibacillus sp. PGB-M46]
MKVDNEKKPVLGIDLGTTYSAIARWTEKGPKVYQNPKGDYTCASVVYYDGRQEKPLVGAYAAGKAVIDPSNAIIGVKRMMDDADQTITLGGKEFSPIDISSIIIKDVFEYAKKTTPGFDPAGIVVTVPYYFTAVQNTNTSEAAEKAGLNVLGIIQEPIAAALAYGIHEEEALDDEIIMVFDLGGGTFDITIFRFVNDTDKLTFEVLATGGDDRLGGLDFDNSMMNYIIEKAGIEFHGHEETAVLKAKKVLLEAAKEAKETLSFEEMTEIIKPNVLPGRHIELDIERSELEECLVPFFQKIDMIIDDVIDKASLSKQDITRVIKVGGSSRIPKMDEMLAKKIGDGKIYGNIDPDLCVAEGASVYAAYLEERLSWSKEIDIKTATAHALGIGLGDGRFSVLIPANRRTPCEASRTFTTNTDNCESLDIDLYQGSSKLVRNNKKIGTIHVGGLAKRPAGELDIKITFRISQQQNVSVTVEQKESNIRKVENVKLS